MTRTTLLKRLKERSRNETVYNNTLNDGIQFFRKLHDLGVQGYLPTCTNDMFLVSLINEKVKQCRRIQREQPDRYKESQQVQKELLAIKKSITGWGRV